MAKNQWFRMAAGIGLLILGGCASLGDLITPPSVRVLALNPVRLTPETVEFLARLEVTNRNPVSLPIDRVDFQTRVNGRTLFDGALTAPGMIPAMSAQEIEVPFRLKFAELIAAAGAVKAGGALTVVLDGRLAVAQRWGFPSLPFTLSRTLPVPHLPVIAVSGLKQLDAGRIGLELRVRNGNSFPLELQRISGSVRLGDAKYALADLAAPRTVSPGGEASLVLALGDTLDKTMALAAALLAGRRLNLGVSAEVTGQTLYGQLSLPYESGGGAER